MVKLPQLPTVSSRLKWPLFIFSGLLSGLVWALLVRLIDTHSLAQLAAALMTNALWLTALFIGSLILALSFLTRSLFIGNLITGLAGTVLAFINYYKVSITFLPLSISDFSLIGQVGHIADLNKASLTPRPIGILALVLAVVWLAGVFLLSRMLQLPRKDSLAGCCAAAVVFALVFWFNVDAAIFSPLGVSTELSLTQTAINKETGVVLGLWRSLYHTATYIPAPSTEFSEDSLEDLLQKLEGNTSSSSPANPVTPSVDPKPADPVTPPVDPKPDEPVTPPADPKPDEPVTPPADPKPDEPVTPPADPKPDEPVTPPADPKPINTRPNLILVLSESFFDVTTLPGVTYDTDPIPEFHALQRESVSGSFYTRTLGYGTCSIELEILTGINTVLLNREDLSSMDPAVFGRLPSVPALLKSSGYDTTLLHMFNDSIYHRRSLFKNLQFDKMYFSEDFAQFHTPAREASSYWSFMKPHISGEFYSDNLMSELLPSLFESRRAVSSSPQFLYAISMENHGPHISKYFSSEYTVAPHSSLTGEAAASLKNAVQGAANASAALGKLVDYFRTVNEPTIIVFFGDHRPGLGLSDGSSVYSALGMVPADATSWTLEQTAELYSADYLIWSNDPAYLPGAPGSTADTSSNYLGVQLLDLLGVEKSLHWRTLAALSQTRCIDTLLYHRGTDGTLSYSAPTQGDEGQLMALLAGLFSKAIYNTGG